MKKVIVLLLMVCTLFSATGCSFLRDLSSLTKQTEEVFLIDIYHLQITADSTFYEKTGGSFDLQITNDDAYISIMAYKYIDLPQNVTPRDVYDMQNEDLFSKRSAVTTVSEEKEGSLSQHVVVQALYSAENDGVKNYYAAYLVDFPEAETFAWVLVTAMPSYLDENMEYLNSIVCSLTVTE